MLNYDVKSTAIVQAVETHPTSDPFGAVQGGYVHIKGSFCAAVLKGPFNRAPTLDSAGAHWKRY